MSANVPGRSFGTAALFPGRGLNDILRKFAAVMLALFTAATLTVPAAVLNKVLFVILFGLMLVAPLARTGRMKVRTLSPLIILSVFFYGFALSFVGETDRPLTNQLMLSVVVLPLIYFVDWYGIDFERIIRICGVFLCLFSGVAIFAVVIAPDSSVGAFYADYFIEYSQGAAGERGFSDETMFFFRVGAAPFLFLPYCLFMQSFLRDRRFLDLIALLLIGALIVVTTSRALMLVCLIASGYLVLIRLRPSRQLVALCITAAAGIFVMDYLLTHTGIFSLREYSNSIKVGHIVSFFEHMTPARILFGEGLAAYYFSSGLNSMTAQTEITLLDTIRFFGIPLTALVYAALLFPTLRREAYRNEKRTAVFLFLLYLAMSLTNPVLFNSYGLLIVVWYWSKTLDLGPRQGPETKEPVT